MPKIKKLLKSPENRQQFKTIIIGMAVLISTFGATLLTGWITSLKSAPEEIFPPNIQFERQGDLLIAKSNQEIETWQYVGPRRKSTCDESIFASLLVGKTFKEGNQVRLSFERDNNMYYCFRAIDYNQISNLAFYAVTDLEEPIIIFREGQGRLTASLSSDADTDAYTDDWQYILLASPTAACTEGVFLSQAEFIHSSAIVQLYTEDQDNYYCFRLATTDGHYIYQAKEILANENAAILVTVLESGDKLHLSANQKIINWVATKLQQSDDCSAAIFDDRQNYHLSTEQIAVVNLHSTARQNERYCLRAQNKYGVYDYKEYSLTGTDFFVTVSAQLTRDQSRLTLEATTDSNVSQWQIVQVDNLSDCEGESFNAQIPISNRNSTEIEYPSTTSRIYCWQASNGQDKAYAAYVIPAGNMMVATYRAGNQIKALSLRSQLKNWQYVSQSLIPSQDDAKIHCSNLDFNAGNQIVKQQNIVVDKVQQYCFRAEDPSGQNHYGYWFTADLQSNTTQAEETAAIWADNLELTELGRYVFYQTKPKFYKELSDLHNVCQSKTKISCYSAKDGRIHIHKVTDYSNHPIDVKADIAQAIRRNYLTIDQRLAQNSELLILYKQNKTAFDKILPANFYANRFYEEEFLEEFYVFLMSQSSEEINIDDWQENSWQKHYQLFFN